MKTLKHLVLVLLLALALPLVVAAQDDEHKIPEGWVDWHSEDEAFHLAHPEGWVVESPGDGSVLVANSQELLDRLLDEDEENDIAEPGDQALSLFVLPAELSGMMGIQLVDGMPADEVAAAVLTAMMGMEEEDTTTEYGEAEAIELEDGASFGIIPITMTEDNLQGQYAVYQEGDLLVIGFLVAANGEFEEFEETAQQIFATFHTDLTSDELMDLMMGTGAEDGASPDATEEATEDAAPDAEPSATPAS